MNVICTRDTPEWGEMNEEKFLSQDLFYGEEYWTKYLNDMWDKVQTWNANCSISYFRYRQGLKEIALRNIQRVKQTKIVSIRDFYQEIDLDEISILISIDDDDWLAPNIFQYLENITKPHVDVIVWNHTVLHCTGNTKFFTNRRFFTNNFALTRSGVNKIFSSRMKNHVGRPRFSTNPVDVHDRIHERVLKTNFLNVGQKLFDRFQNLRDSFNVSFLKDRLNITNKSMASTTSLVKIGDVKHLMPALRDVANKKIVPPLPWAFKETEEFNKLNQQLAFCKL